MEPSWVSTSPRSASSGPEASAVSFWPLSPSMTLPAPESPPWLAPEPLLLESPALPPPGAHAERMSAEPAARAAAAESFVYFMEGASVHERCKDVARPRPCGELVVRDDPRAVPSRRDVP